VPTKDGIRTLVNIVIIDSTHANLLPQWCTIQKKIAPNSVAQTKQKSYCNQHPINLFLPLIIEIFGCPHKQANIFLHNCANAIWSFKRPKGLFLFILVPFLHQFFLITLQRMQATSILNWVVMVNLTTFRLPSFQYTHASLWPTYFKWLIVEMERFWHLICTNLMLTFFKFSLLF